MIYSIMYISIYNIYISDFQPALYTDTPIKVFFLKCGIFFIKINYCLLVILLPNNKQIQQMSLTIFKKRLLKKKISLIFLKKH